MPAIIVAERTLVVGKPAVVEAPAPASDFAVVFEDDGETGYLYGLNLALDGQQVLDALHIYNVKQVADGEKPSNLQIFWSEDSLKSALLINQYPHAIFDFEVKRGYCRTNFPPPDERWTTHGHEWDDSAVELFK